MATLRTVIKTYEANALAQAIATKAFEHVFPSLERELTRKAEDFYTAFLGEENIERFIKAGILVQPSGLIKMFNSEGDLLAVKAVKFDDNRMPSSYKGIELILTDEQVEETRELFAAYEDISDRIKRLAAEIKGQVTGRTVKAVMNAWPEAAHVIATTLHVDDATVSSLDTPLSSILTRFMPALPAPAEGEVDAAQ